MNASDTFARWRSLCGTPVGGDNLIRVDGILYALDLHPKSLGNGAIVGRIHRHMGGTFQDIGGFKIGADGAVLACPEVLRATLNPEARPEMESLLTAQKDHEPSVASVSPVDQEATA